MIKPRIGRRVIFKPTGEECERIGLVQFVVRPQKHTRYNSIQYGILYDDTKERILVDRLELIGYDDPDESGIS